MMNGSRQNKRIAETDDKTRETPFEAIAGISYVLVIGLFVLTFLGQNFVIPSGSMENTLLIGDHLLVDRTTLAPPTKWMPMVHYREPRRGDVVVFYKPVADIDPNIDNGEPQYPPLVKRLIAVPGDRVHLHDGIVYVNGVAQDLPKDSLETPAPAEEQVFLDEFPALTPVPRPGSFITESWATDFHNHVENGDLIVPANQYFMMGDHRHNSADSRFWGFVPRENIIGRPLFNYWSFRAPEQLYTGAGISKKITSFGYVAIHFVTDTRWARTLKLIH